MSPDEILRQMRDAGEGRRREQAEVTASMADDMRRRLANREAERPTRVPAEHTVKGHPLGTLEHGGDLYAFPWHKQPIDPDAPEDGVVLQFEPLPGLPGYHFDVCVDWSERLERWGVNLALGDGEVQDPRDAQRLGFLLLAAAEAADELNRNLRTPPASR